MAEATLFIKVRYDENKTDPESVATAMDNMLSAAEGLLWVESEYGKIKLEPFLCLQERETKPVQVVQVIDPDTKEHVEVEIRKVVDGGYMVGIDGSYLAADVGPVYDPCNFGVQLIIPDDEGPYDQRTGHRPRE